MNVDLVQPDISPLKNCTAASSQAGLLIVYPWLAIQCDAQYEASFVCQNIETQTNQTTTSMSKVVNLTCEVDWFMINGSDKFFSVSVSRPNTALSYYHAQHICTKHNASLFRAEVAPRNVPMAQCRKLNDIIIHGLLEYSEQEVPEYMCNMRPETLPYILFGERLPPEIPQNHLPQVIEALLDVGAKADFDHTFYTDISNTCSVVETSVVSHITMLGQATSAKTKSWGVKCRSCFERLNTSAIICERDSKPYIQDCSEKQFRCNDGTCILLVYRCDLDNDCFDASDEKTV